MVTDPINLPNSFCRLALAVIVAVAALALSLGNAQAQAQKGLVDINTATQQELEAVKGVGAATAKKIIAGRPYKSLDELTKAGLPAKKIAPLKPYLTVGKAPAAPALTPAAEQKPKAAPAAAKPQVPPPAGKEVAPSKQAPASPPAAAAPVDLNMADQKALESLPGIGPALAKKIMEGRPFQSVDDLSRIKGMNKSKIDAIKDKVTVAAPKPVKPTPAPAAAKPQVTPAPAAAKPEPTPAPPAAKPQATPAVGKEAAPSKEVPAATKLSPGEKVNLNTAPKEDLDKLPGIGPVKAQAIIEGRPFEKIEDIMKVKGIKEGEFGKIKDLITVK
jgi:competence protein ComEA